MTKPQSGPDHFLSPFVADMERGVDGTEGAFCFKMSFREYAKLLYVALHVMQQYKSARPAHAAANSGENETKLFI